MYPPWSTTFDAHIHRGRVMHVVVKDQTAELKSEAVVPLDLLATRCKKENGKLEIWVRTWTSPAGGGAAVLRSDVQEKASRDGAVC